MKNYIQKDDAPSPSKSLYFETDFYMMASALRGQFEKHIMNFSEGNVDVSPLQYASCPDQFQFLTAGAHRMFTRSTLDDFIDELGAWAGEALGASHVSMPQVRVYVNGCWRDLLRDDIGARWHYLLSLTRARQRQKRGQITVLTDNIASDGSGELSIDRFMSLSLEFNQLLVHDGNKPYEVRPALASRDPLDGEIFLDGYLW